ncbi:MAG: phosphoribosylanthranilate isomerase [Gemmatimonadota bacterium]
MTGVKICGLCRPEDARAAADAGADWTGVILAPGGRRSRTPEQARAILDAARGAGRVGVFVDADVEEAGGIAVRLRLDVIQLHGGESPERVAAIREAGRWRVWKAVRPRDHAELRDAIARFADVADALLLDGWSARAAGGTGTRFPWRVVEEERDAWPDGVRLVVAGGLTPATVVGAVRRLRPDAVDVSSGVERRVGRKDADLVRAFVRRARSARPSSEADVSADVVGPDGTPASGARDARDGVDARRAERGTTASE